MNEPTDLSFEDHGTLVLVSPATDQGREWLDEHCPEGADHTYLGGSLVVESRYAPDLFEAALGDGLTAS